MVLGNVGRLGKVPTFVRKMTVNGIEIAKTAKTLPLTGVFRVCQKTHGHCGSSFPHAGTMHSASC